MLTGGDAEQPTCVFTLEVTGLLVASSTRTEAGKEAQEWGRSVRWDLEWTLFQPLLMCSDKNTSLFAPPLRSFNLPSL